MEALPLDEKINDLKVVLKVEDFQQLLDALIRRDYQVVGPTLKEGAVVYDSLTRVSQLPAGWTDEQQAGHYSLKKRSDQAYFGYGVGPQSWKKFLFPPRITLWKQKSPGEAPEPAELPQDAPRYAFLGVRACELKAITLQDQVFLTGPFIDPIYQARREKVFIVAVNCGQAGANCFCASVGSGPQVTQGYDLALTEVTAAPEAYFLVEVGSQAGQTLLNEVTHRPATGKEVAEARQVVERAASEMSKSLATADLKDFLYTNYENPYWAEVAGRCLACANCTLVCPTCFCTSPEDVSDLTGQVTEHRRRWDSCFSLDFSYLHGGSVRPSRQSRYRQWLTHKLGTWQDQFGEIGCVGCGRCITWCPVGIDLTTEIRALRQAAATLTAGTETNPKSDER
ncbi:MAG: 4Fe-4S dicluster domain-containing protein [Chloroflexi bacterium]|nr:4Fe-4S dicluster domain-containing protein [Chloroflexota bacterium]OJW01870.1 MAG: sulfite reductase subunit A [Chloroflexi bacterium 54-19]